MKSHRHEDWLHSRKSDSSQDKWCDLGRIRVLGGKVFLGGIKRFFENQDNHRCRKRHSSSKTTRRNCPTVLDLSKHGINWKYITFSCKELLCLNEKERFVSRPVARCWPRLSLRKRQSPRRKAPCQAAWPKKQTSKTSKVEIFANRWCANKCTLVPPGNPREEQFLLPPRS